RIEPYLLHTLFLPFFFFYRSLTVSQTIHRQSLGSPSSKLHSHGGGEEEILIVEESKHGDSISSSIHVEFDEDHNNKATKAQRLSSPPSRPERFIHLIRILTLVCFTILYLCSHSPSQSDLAQFSGFNGSSKHIVNRGGFLAIRSLHNLQEIGKDSRKSQSHRKFAYF
ncbi:Ribosome maturation factor, partial [Quillaja saponaria]